MDASVALVALASVTVGAGVYCASHVDAYIEERKHRAVQGDEEEALFETATADANHALWLPLLLSGTLLALYFFHDYIKYFVLLSGAVYACAAMAFLLWQGLQRMGVSRSGALVAAVVVASVLVFGWVVTGHWVINNVMACSLCVGCLMLLRLPSLRVAVLIGVALLLFDAFWVFGSPYLFRDNVMVKVATRKSDNPATSVAKTLHVPKAVIKRYFAVSLSFLNKIEMHSWLAPGHVTFLGLGDIVLPGAIVVWASRMDTLLARIRAPSPATYFKVAYVAYTVGLVLAVVSSRVFQSPQPALVQVIPVLMAVVVAAGWKQGELGALWRGHRVSPSPSSSSRPLSHALSARGEAGPAYT